MDEKKHTRKRADGIRRETDAIRPRSSIAPTLRASESRANDGNSRESVREPVSYDHKEKTVYAESKKQGFFERPNTILSSKESYTDVAKAALKSQKRYETASNRVIHDGSFQQEVLPHSFAFLRHKNVIALIAGMGSVCVVWLLLSTIFARVTITVKPVVERLQINDMNVVFDASLSDVNVQTRTIPAEFLSFDGKASMNFDATGNDAVNQKAIGHVRIYNAFNTSAQPLVASTRFVIDSNGILFRLPKNIVIPAAKKDEKEAIIPQFIETDLVADKAGVGSNVSGEVKLHIPGFKGGPKYDGFYAVATNGFSGGTIGVGRVVTRADLAAAQEKVSKKVFDDLKQNMAQKIPANFTFVDSLSEIQIMSITAPKEKTGADTFTVEVKAVAHVFVFRDMDMMQLMNGLVMGDDHTKSLVDKSADVHYQIKNANYDKKIAQVAVNGTVKTKTVIDSKDIAQLAAGKKEGSLIEAMKARRDVATFRVAFFPPWIFSVPSNSNQVNVIIEEPTGDVKSVR